MAELQATPTDTSTPVTPPLSHLRTGFGAVLIILCLLAAGRMLLGLWAAQFLDRYARTGDDEVIRGMVLTRYALRQPDRLVLMGSSELTFQDEYHAAHLFAGKPTGFDLHLVGSGYRQSINNFLVLSALGREVRDKRLVMFVSPTWFQEPLSQRAYKKNYSRLQAYELAFASDLSPALRQRGAQRILALGAPTTNDALLTSGLRALSGDGWDDRLRYWASWPLGRLALESLRLKDDLDVIRGAYSRKFQAYPRQPAPDWDALLARAAQSARDQSRSNDLGIFDGYYTKHVAPRLDKIRGSATSETWLASPEYGDLQLVLDALVEQGARPLFISVPVHGPYYDLKGHPRADRDEYYRRVKAQIESAGFPVVDFSGGEYEPGFMRDPWHQGWKGSVLIARTIDEFYHDRLAPAGNAK